MKKLKEVFRKWLKDHKENRTFSTILPMIAAIGVPLVGIPAFCALSVARNTSQFIVIFVFVFVIMLLACLALGGDPEDGGGDTDYIKSARGYDSRADPWGW